MRETPNHRHTVRWIHTIDGGSCPLLVLYTCLTSASDYSWCPIIDNVLYHVAPGMAILVENSCFWSCLVADKLKRQWLPEGQVASTPTVLMLIKGKIQFSARDSILRNYGQI